MKVLIIGDTHAMPEYSNSRFDLAGKLLLEQQPDLLLCTGDHRDLASLCVHSSRLDVDGSRVMDELHAAADAEERLLGPYLRWRKKTKKKDHMKRVLLEGNHCTRLEKLESERPQLQGLMSIPWHHGWSEVVPFKTSYEVIPGRVIASHYYTSGVMERPISAPDIARKLVQKNMVSSIVGHSHILDYAEMADKTGRKVWGLSAGCFVPVDYRPAWCKQSRDSWWNGVILLELDNHGQILRKDELTMEYLERQYG